MLSVEKQIKRQQMLLESFQGYKILKKEPKKKKELNEWTGPDEFKQAF